MFKVRWKSVFTAFFTLHGVLFSIAFGWCVLACVNFGYGFWHDNTGIAEAIERFGPQNKFKPGFETTTRAERIEIFSQINWSIHNGGEGLEDISYTPTSGAGPQKLLREPEIVHLQDVANLIDVLFYPMVYGLLMWPAMCVWALRKRSLPNARGQLITLGSVIVCLVSGVFIVGPEKLFNQLHIWVFPDDHQWFFYYQESLMSTMMFAPNLFGWIAVFWGGVVILVYLVCILGLKRLARARLIR